MAMDKEDLNELDSIFKEMGGVDKVEEYNSHNTTRLDVEGMKKLLLKLDLFKDCK